MSEYSPPEERDGERGRNRARAFKAIAGLAVSAQHKAVLWTLLEHAEWLTLDNAFPSNATIGAWTSLSESSVQRLLRELTCTDSRGIADARQPCGRCTVLVGKGQERRRVPKVEVLVRTEPRHRYDHRRFALVLGEVGEQLMLPEVGSALGPLGVVTATPWGGDGDTPGVVTALPMGGDRNTRGVVTAPPDPDPEIRPNTSRRPGSSTAARARARSRRGEIRTALCKQHGVEGRESKYLEGQYLHPLPDGSRCEFVPGEALGGRAVSTLGLAYAHVVRQ